MEYSKEQESQAVRRAGVVYRQGDPDLQLSKELRIPSPRRSDYVANGEIGLVVNHKGERASASMKVGYSTQPGVSYYYRRPRWMITSNSPMP